MDEVATRVGHASVDLLDPGVGPLPPAGWCLSRSWSLAPGGDALRVRQLLLGVLEVARVGHLKDLLAIRSGPGVKGSEADVDADDPLWRARGANPPLDLDGEGDGPLATTLADRGGHDLGRPAIHVSVELAGGLVGLTLAAPRDANVVGVAQAHRRVREPHRATLAPALEGGELRAAPVEVGEGLAETLGSVVVSADPVLSPPRGQLVALLGPEIEQSEVRGREVVVLRHLETGRLLLTVLVPVGRDEAQQGVVGETRATDVATQRVGLLGSGVDREGVGLGRSERRSAGVLEEGCGHGVSIGSGCDISLTPSPTQFAEGDRVIGTRSSTIDGLLLVVLIASRVKAPPTPT